jgi:hypothetical protein
MRRRVLHWIGWNLGFSLLPLLAIAVLAYLEPAPGRSVRAFLGSADVALVAVGWLGASMGELRDTRMRWSGRRDVVAFVLVVLITVNATVFGASYRARTNGAVVPGGPGASRRSTTAAVTDLVLAGILSTIAVAIGTSKERRRP